MAMSKKNPEQEFQDQEFQDRLFQDREFQDRSAEIEALLPWYTTQTLSVCDTRRVEQAISRRSRLAGQYAAVEEECAGIVLLNESLGAPSSFARRKLFAAIDAELRVARRGRGAA